MGTVEGDTEEASGPFNPRELGKFGEERWGTNRSKPLSSQQTELAQESPFDAAHTSSSEGIRT